MKIQKQQLTLLLTVSFNEELKVKAILLHIRCSSVSFNEELKVLYRSQPVLQSYSRIL